MRGDGPTEALLRGLPSRRLRGERDAPVRTISLFTAILVHPNGDREVLVVRSLPRRVARAERPRQLRACGSGCKVRIGKRTKGRRG